MKPIKLPVAHERELLKLLSFMNKQIRERIENQVLKELNKSTINKFADKQEGNFISIFEKLLNQARRSIANQFSEARLKRYIQELFKKVDKKNTSEITTRVNQALGVDFKKLVLSSQDIRNFSYVSILKTVEEIIKYRDDSFERYRINILREAIKRNNLNDLFALMITQNRINSNKAKTIARNEIKTFFSQLNHMRYEKLGITEAVWVTANDNRVRGKKGGLYENAKHSHAKLDGKTYNIKKGAEVVPGVFILPGEEINCRCISIPIIPQEIKIAS